MQGSLAGEGAIVAAITRPEGACRPLTLAAS